MTLAELRTEVKLEARVKVSTNLDDMITHIIQEILRDYGNKARYREVLIIDSPITLVDSQSTYALPDDFQHMQGVRYSVTGTRFLPLYEFTEGFLRISDVGLPKYFQLCSTGLLVYPSSQIRTTNTLFISYYGDPAALYADDDADFPIPRLEATVKKMTIARIIRYMQQMEEADRMSKDGGDSFAASQGGQ